MSQETFQVSYDGGSVATGSVDVYLLAPALISTGELVKATNEVLNGDTATVSLRVQSDFKTGSFEVSLILGHTLLESVKGLFTADTGIGAAGLLRAIFGSVKAGTGAIEGVFKLYKALRGEKPKTTLIDQSTNTTIFVMGSGNEVVVEKSTAQLYTNEKVIRNIDQVVRPLSNNTIGSLEVRRDREVVDRIERRDLPLRLTEPDQYKELELVEGDRLSSTKEMLLKVNKVNFEGGNWTFSDGQAKFGAAIEDVEFKDKVTRREEGFFAGDTLHVILRTSQKIGKNDKLEMKYTIERVLRHIHSPRAGVGLFDQKEPSQVTSGDSN